MKIRAVDDQPPGIMSMCGDLTMPKTAPVRQDNNSRATIPNELILTSSEAYALESRTKEQRHSDEWHSARNRRITASNFAKIIKRRQISNKFVEEMLLNKSFSAASTSYGLSNEENAKHAFLRQQPDAHMHEIGLVVNPAYPFLGATPDARICIDGTTGIAEIKCPYSARDLTIAQASQQLKSFCLEASGNDYKLKFNHDYWYQVQGQLLVTGAPFCMFIVYTKTDLWHSKILPDIDAMEMLLNKLSKFYIQHVQPTQAYAHDDQIQLEMDVEEIEE